jgi:hypothetical protein
MDAFSHSRQWLLLCGLTGLAALVSCAEERSAPGTLVQRKAEMPALPQPELVVMWVHGLSIESLEGEPDQPLTQLALGGSRMGRCYAVAAKSEDAAACFWNGSWPHEQKPAPASASDSAFAEQLKVAGYDCQSPSSPEQVLGAGGDAVGSPALRAWLVELDLRSEAGGASWQDWSAALAAASSEASQRLIVILGAGALGPELRETHLHAPALLHWPGKIPGDAVRPQLANSLDVRATVLELVGAAPDASSAHGQSFQQLLRQIRQVWRAYVCAEALVDGQWRLWLRTGEWSYTRHGNGRSGVFSLESDPSESIDMGGRPEVQAIESHLASLMDEWSRRSAYRPSDN